MRPALVILGLVACTPSARVPADASSPAPVDAPRPPAATATPTATLRVTYRHIDDPTWKVCADITGVEISDAEWYTQAPHVVQIGDQRTTMVHRPLGSHGVVTACFERQPHAETPVILSRQW
jgi:hypothetical protein